MKLTKQAIEILKERYLLRDKNRKVVENPEEMCRRVAHAVALAEIFYLPEISLKKGEEKCQRKDINKQKDAEISGKKL